MALEPITRQEKIIAGHDLTPITRMEKFLKQYGGGSGGVTSWNDLTDKPFVETTTVKEVLAECQPVFSAASGDDAFDTFYIMNPFEIVPDEKYIVSWNGVEYLSTAAEIGGVQVLGNLSAFEMEDTGEPFLIQTQGGQPDAIGYAVIIPFDGSTTLTISIRQEVTEVKKISGKYVEGMGWTEREIGVIYENEAEGFTYDEGYGYSWSANAITTHLHNLVIGEKYTVIFDGVTYSDLVALTAPSGQMYIGTTPDALTEDMPFSVLTWEYEGASLMGVYAYGDALVHSISVTGIKKETVYPIDAKFMPDFDVVIEVDDIDPTGITKESFTVRKLDTKAVEDKVKRLREPTVLIYHGNSDGSHAVYVYRPSIVNAVLSYGTEKFNRIIIDLVWPSGLTWHEFNLSVNESGVYSMSHTSVAATEVIS